MKIVLEPRNYKYNQMVLLDTESGEVFEFSRVDRPDLAELVKTPAEVMDS